MLFLITVRPGYSQEPDTIAVFPFQVIGDTGNLVLYSYGLPDAIANDLANVPGLVIVERIQLSKILYEYKLSQTGLIDESKVPKIGGLLSANLLIVGTVQKSGRDVRVHARIIKCSTGEIIFGAKVERRILEFKDLFYLEDYLISEIIRNLKNVKSDQTTVKKRTIPTYSEDAFRHYSNGIKEFDKGNYKIGLLQIKKAIEQDNGFVEAKNIYKIAKQAFDELDREVEKLKCK